MEAKVDIRKLQLLNDRIAQVTDALNQVRLSVHGLTHTGMMGQQFAGGPFGGTPQQPFGTPQQPFGFPQQAPYAFGQQIGQLTPGFPSSLGGVPSGQIPWQSGAIGGGFGQLQHTGAYGPYGQAAMGYAPFSQGLFGGVSPWAGTGWGSSFSGGLSHSPELTEQQRGYDPNRIFQTFPFCMAPQSGVSSW